MTVPSDALRVGLLTPAWPGRRTPNGIATAVGHLHTGMVAIGCKVTIIADQIDGEERGATVVGIPDQRRTFASRLRARRDPWGAFHRAVAERIAAAVNEAVRLHGIEVFVMEESFGWAGTVQRLVDIPVVVTLHGPWCLHKGLHGGEQNEEDFRRETAEKVALGLVKGITSPSLNALELTRAAYGLPDVPQKVIRNPMPLPRQDVVPHNVSGAQERMLFVGRFDYHKGGDVVIEAFAKIASLHPGCSLTFVGPDPGVVHPDGRRLALSEALARLPTSIRARIDFRGVCSREEVAALRSSHAIAIVASRYENFGGTMIEAMAAGSALVCTAVGGCPEMITDGETGLLIPPADPDAMATACLRLLQNQDIAARIGAAARRHIGQELDPALIGRQMAEFLTPICRG